MKEEYYDFKVVNKPWGYEYVAYRNKKILSLAYLKINYKNKTSLHCHPNKKTGFILLKGKAKIQLGFDKSIICAAPEKIMIRSGLFHSIEAISKTGIIALEFETPVIKNDLVRYYDKYGRQKKPYEGKSFFINKEDIIKFKTPKVGKKIYYLIGKSKVLIETFKDIKKVLKKNPKYIIAILKGSLVNEKKQKVLSEGDIVRVPTIEKLSKKFRIRTSITTMTVF